jgi:ABC-2 type transport system permease protein
MRNIILITINSIKNNLKSKALTIVFVCITLMIAVGLALFFCLLLIAPAMNVSVPDRTQMELYLSLIMYTTCIICLGINMNVFAFQSMTREKSRGNIESLMATPLSVKNIWIAKSLAVFIPGMVLGEILTLSALLAVNYIYFVPKIGFVYTHWIGLASFLAVPLLYLCLSLLVHLIGMTGKPATGNVVAQIFLPITLTLMINLVLRYVLDAASWPFTLANFGVAAVIAIIVIFLQPRITRERIVLSR